jgi:hypothetical protein
MDLATLQGTEAFFTDDAYLKPVIQDDPLLREFSCDAAN